MTKGNIGIVLRNLGRYEDSLKQLESSLLILEKHYGKDHVVSCYDKRQYRSSIKVFR